MLADFYLRNATVAVLSVRLDKIFWSTMTLL